MCLCNDWNRPVDGNGCTRFVYLTPLLAESIQPTVCYSFSGRVGPQQQLYDRFSLWRLSFTIAIHPPNRQRFVELYHCHWAEDILKLFNPVSFRCTAVSNGLFCIFPELLSFMVALFWAAAIFNRLVLHYRHCLRSKSQGNVSISYMNARASQWFILKKSTLCSWTKMHCQISGLCGLIFCSRRLEV